MVDEPSDNRDASVPRSDRYFRTVFNDPHVFMALLGPDGEIRHVNRTAAELVTPDEDEIVGRPFWTGPWWTHSERTQQDLRWRVERAAAGEYIEFETEYYTGGDEQRLTSGFLRPVRDEDGAVVSIVASGRDVTEQVYRRQRLDVLQRILRHDFRNGLNLVRGYAEEIATRLSAPDDSGERADVEAMARTIADRATDLAESVGKIQQLERHDSGETIAVETLFTRVVADVRAEYPDCHIPSTTPRPDIEVPAAFRTAVTEAVTNAVEYHPRSDPTIELSAAVVDETDPPHVRLSIVDDGRGIPRSEIDPVLAGEETSLTHPSGVGLWVIKWTVEQHGGELSITPNEPKGSRVTLTYPLPSRST